jgi:uncharacterized protein (TIGR03083 family)
MDPTTYIAHIRSDGPAVLAAGEASPTTMVPSCPDWTLAELVGHVGSAHRWAADMVRTRAKEASPFVKRPEDWDEVRVWYRAGVAMLISALESVDAEEEVWNWAVMGTGPVRFWHRRMAQETAVHRWDAENALGRPQPIDAALAIDGIDEAISNLAVSLRMRPRPELVGSVRLITTDADFECSVTLAGDGLSRRDDLGRSDVVVHGGASDLLLWLLGRPVTETVEVEGDVGVAEKLAGVGFG